MPENPYKSPEEEEKSASAGGAPFDLQVAVPWILVGVVIVCLLLIPFHGCQLGIGLPM